MLPELRGDGLLTAEVLEALPLDAAHFPPDSMFRPLFEAVRDALAGEELIPTADGYHRAADVRLAAGAELHDLLSPGQLGALAAPPGARSSSPVRPSRRTSPRSSGRTCATRSGSS